MSPRKKYKKRNQKKRISVNKQIEIFRGIILLLGLIGFLIYSNLKGKNFDNIILFLQIFIPTLIIIILLIIYYFYKRKKRIEKERLEQMPEFLLKLKNKIKLYKPMKKFDKEEPYQIGLHGHLQNEYPELEIEKYINYKRPDIIIDDIAIEIKGPTSMSELKTIPQKIINYLKERDYLFIVLFDIKITNNPEKSKELYQNWKNDIYETFENKKDKIIFIEK